VYHENVEPSINHGFCVDLGLDLVNWSYHNGLGNEKEIFMFDIVTLLGFLVIGFYFYVAVAMMRAEFKADTAILPLIVRGLVWPATIWGTIEKLFRR